MVMKYFRYYEDGGWQFRMDIMVKTTDKNKAVDIIWKHLNECKNVDASCMEMDDVRNNTKQVEIKEGVIYDASTFGDLNGHFD
jgi:hypothetical protein